MSFARNTSWSAAGSITSSIGRMAVTVILARRLGPELFGVFIFVQWLIEMAFLIYSVGLTGAATRFFPQSPGDDADRMPGFTRWFLQLGAVATLLTGCFATLAVVTFSEAYEGSIAAISFWAASYAIWGLLSSRAQGLFQFKRFATSSAIFAIVALLGLSLPQVGGDLSGAMVAVGAANLAAGAWCIAGTLKSDALRSERLAEAHSGVVRTYATNVWLTTIVSSLVWSRGEISLVKGQLGETAVGFYSVGLTLAGMVNQGVGLLTGALWPQVAYAWDKGEHEKLLLLSNLVTRLLMLVAGVSAGFVICFGPYIVILLFGAAFAPTKDLVLILALGPLGLTGGCAHLVIQAATSGKFGRDVTFAGGIALFSTAFMLIPIFGVEGAAASRSAVQIGIAIFTLAWFGRFVAYSPETRHNLLSFLLVVTVAGALAVFLGASAGLPILSLCALFGVYCLVIYAICSRGWNADILKDLRRLSQAAGA